ncbi:hypothetical protein CWI38_0578p0030 [Hamiltosporidium tvaerminnensis]|uniref:Uncharacterized protein n=1 Tax=Hamiltosporidium tvaerminnensis TaxID=1176355 RepID=A0A4Q9LUF3_9MICR|nr:hypothetical protein CWI38_0861p0010 [Hamiltosporidium tvaerminnensis]TBU12945.1 hypothetical protein CWI38_0578p0030 [Hamiltosporidium tvaerminnensis]
MNRRNGYIGAFIILQLLQIIFSAILFNLKLVEIKFFTTSVVALTFLHISSTIYIVNAIYEKNLAQIFVGIFISTVGIVAEIFNAFDSDTFGKRFFGILVVLTFITQLVVGLRLSYNDLLDIEWYYFKKIGADADKKGKFINLIIRRV